MLKNIRIFIFGLGINGLLLLGGVGSHFIQARGSCPATSFGYALSMLNKGSLDSFMKMNQHHLRNLTYNEVKELQSTAHMYRAALEVARELYQDKELQNMVNQMQAEVAAMPAQPMPEPGAGFRPNIWIYI